MKELRDWATLSSSIKDRAGVVNDSDLVVV